jgi:hypothetical protein
LYAKAEISVAECVKADVKDINTPQEREKDRWKERSFDAAMTNKNIVQC